MSKRVQTKADLAKSGASCLVGALILLSIIFIFINWKVALLIFIGAIIYGSISNKEAKELEESGEVYLGGDANLLNLEVLHPEKEPFAIVIDVETTGLLVDDTVPTLRKVKENPDWYPRIVQIGWITLTRHYEIVEKQTFYIKQNEPIPEKSILIHGITNEICEKEGVDLEYVMIKFRDSVEPCEYFVGHNVLFDKYVIEAECIKNNFPKPFKYMKAYDTMKMGGAITQKRKFKLEELANKIFGKRLLSEKNIVFHNAISDVWITASIFSILHKNKLKY